MTGLGRHGPHAGEVLKLVGLFFLSLNFNILHESFQNNVTLFRVFYY